MEKKFENKNIESFELSFIIFKFEILKLRNFGRGFHESTVHPRLTLVSSQTDIDTWLWLKPGSYWHWKKIFIQIFELCEKDLAPPEETMPPKITSEKEILSISIKSLIYSKVTTTVKNINLSQKKSSAFQLSKKLYLQK